MKLLRYAVIAVAVAITGCASTGGHHHRNLAGLDKQQKDIWERIRKEFDMPDLDNDPKVDYWTQFYASRPQMIHTMAERSRRYIYYITKELEKRDMPSELALLPFVESAYNAKALSRSKAAGLWQFIPSTGTHYNLTQDWWRDDRQDTIHSTRAALDYLEYLYQFQDNDWHLALASYNWGEGAVRRARDRNAAQGLGTDFLSLRMPNETRNYVPKLLAIKRIIANPSKYGVTLPNVPDQPYFAEVTKTEDMDVSTIVRLAGISDEEFRLLNPADKRPVILKEHKTRILLPKKNVAIFEQNLKQHKGELSSWRGYTPTPGESLADIAKRHGISLEELKSLNGYGRKQTVAISSRTLLVPRAPGLSMDASPSGINTKEIRNPIAGSSTMLASNQVNLPVQTPSLREVNPNVRLGQSASNAAQPRLVSASRPVVNNNSIGHDDLIGNLVASQNTAQEPTLAQDVRVSTVSTSKARVRTAIYSMNTKVVAPRAVSAPKYTKRSSAGPQIHKVSAGDTLYSLARRYGTTVDGIRALNNLGKRGIRVGEHLRMPGSGVQG
ncbi:lytic transglycosylase [Pelistega europaea]|uniref:Transglycosylase SLT domain-containing protein n=1 Tax=Pelistega europaea TaxID=106147 RepID=A0A7Y4LB24_9BURK|nr:transglycosylase SLT domain-containing protein [Pelistega europaea]NOL49251.1 transglycosylase SLT domain-containing protein [Pelistega europaea]